MVTRFETLTLLCLLFSRWTFFLKGPVEALCRRLGNFLNSGRLLNLRPHDRNRCFPIFRFGSKSLRSAFTRNMHGLCRWTVPFNDFFHCPAVTVVILAASNLGRQFVNPGRGSCLSFCAIERCFADATVVRNWPPPIGEFHSPFFSVTFIIFYSLAVWQNWVSTSTTKDSTLF